MEESQIAEVDVILHLFGASEYSAKLSMGVTANYGRLFCARANGNLVFFTRCTIGRSARGIIHVHVTDQEAVIE